MKRKCIVTMCLVMILTAALLCFAGCGDDKDDAKSPGTTATPAADGLPKAAVFDVEFEDGKAVDKSKNAFPLKQVGLPKIVKDEECGREVAVFEKGSQSAFVIENFNAHYEDVEEAFSQEVFFKMPDIDLPYCVIAANMEQGGFGFDFEPDKNGVKTFGFTLRIGEAYQWAYPDVNTEPGDYIHAVAVYDGVDLLLYIDGELAVETRGIEGPITFPADESAGMFVIGADSGKGETEDYFAGSIAFVRLYDEALEADEVSALFKAAVKKA